MLINVESFAFHEKRTSSASGRMKDIGCDDFILWIRTEMLSAPVSERVEFPRELMRKKVKESKAFRIYTFMIGETYQVESIH